MEFAKEKKRHLTYLGKIRPRPSESQHVLTFTVEKFTDAIRMEYMAFADDHKLQHSWAALLGWWRFRKHSDDKTAVQSLKRTMEIKKREEYTLYHNNNRHHKQRRSPLAAASSPVAASPDDDETTPPPPPPPSPPKKKKTQQLTSSYKNL